MHGWVQRGSKLWLMPGDSCWNERCNSFVGNLFTERSLPLSISFLSLVLCYVSLTLRGDSFFGERRVSWFCPETLFLGVWLEEIFFNGFGGRKLVVIIPFRYRIVTFEIQIPQFYLLRVFSLEKWCRILPKGIPVR